jgi:hypothetical protein
VNSHKLADRNKKEAPAARPPFSMRGVRVIAANPRGGSKLLQFLVKATLTPKSAQLASRAPARAAPMRASNQTET